jgi:hypothetical protein
MPTQWSERARKRVNGWQESDWGEVASSMGLGWKPERAFEALSPPPLPDDLITVDRMRRDVGDDIVPDGDWASVAATMKDYKDRYLVDPPTRFEMSLSYSTLAYELDGALETLTGLNVVLPYRPLVASLPSGDVNAKIRKIPGSDEAVILFQHGLIDFLDQLAIAMGAAMPVELTDLPLRAAAPGGSEPGDRAHWQLAVEQLTDSLTSYVVEGKPNNVRRRSLKGRALANSVFLAAGMRRFLLVHELMHLLFKHVAVPSAKLPEEEAWQREFDADMVAASFCARRSAQARVSSMWACDIALWAFEMLERTLAYLATGALTGLPPTHSHPTPRARRSRLLQEKTQELQGLGETGDAGRLGELTVAGMELGAKLWEATIPHWDGLREKGVRPGPLWTKRLEQAATGGQADE